MSNKKGKEETRYWDDDLEVKVKIKRKEKDTSETRTS